MEHSENGSRRDPHHQNGTTFGKFTVQFKGNLVETMVVEGLLRMLLGTLHEYPCRAPTQDQQRGEAGALVSLCSPLSLTSPWFEPHVEKPVLEG